MSNRSIEEFRSNGWGIHFAMDAAHPNAFTWATVELMLALDALGIAVSIPEAVPHPSIDEDAAGKLKSFMRAEPCDEFHVKWSHFWPHHLQTPLSGQVNVEIMCNNYRYRPNAKHVDLWMRHVQLNNYRKIAVSGFNQQVLADIGCDPEQCPIIPLGYSPEIADVFPEGQHPSGDDAQPLSLLLVTNSYDLHRYGTDLAMKAIGSAYSGDENVVLHIKDYGGGARREEILSWIPDRDSFPKIVWHTDFVSKTELLKLYGASDVLIAPFRGEGFSMKILDAMAIGIPVMMPAFGGPVEYACAGSFVELPHTEIPVGPCSDRDALPLGDDIYWCEVELDGMVEALQRVYKDRSSLRRVGECAREAVLDDFSWNAIAERWLEELSLMYHQRQESLSGFCEQSTVPLTVLMPTKNRLDVMPETLEAYAKQTISAADYELLIINDHGDYDALKAVCDAHDALPIRLIDNQGVGGRSPARNLGITEARGECVLFVGDDIVPAPDLLEKHIQAHRDRPGKENAFLGYTDWHPALDNTPFMQMLVGEGGHQFNYSGCRDGCEISYNAFYTCNISLKRDFIQRETEFLDDIFPYGFEDIEWGYRLHLRGLKLFFLEQARGAHRHPVDPASYVRRQRNMGEDLFRYVLKTPTTDLAVEQWPLLMSLEYNRLAGWPGGATHPDVDMMIANVLAVYERVMAWLAETEESSDPKMQRWKDWLLKSHQNIWECVNELSLREGMAKAWNMNADEEAQAVSWLTMLCLGRVAGPNALYEDLLSGRIPEPPSSSVAVVSDSPFVYHATNALRSFPLLGRIYCRAEKTVAVKSVKQGLGRLIQKARSRG